MIRDLTNLARNPYDLLIIGGGAYGLFTAWDAASRGLSVALVERYDFGHSTSSNTLRVIHGGLRYLQHGHLSRMRVSIRERTNFMGIAPHLVHPLPFLIPTYGHGMRGKEVLSLALKAHDLAGFDRNRLGFPQKRLPASRIISRDTFLSMCPSIEASGLTGGGLLYDAQMYSSERLIAGVLCSAAQAGACLANYVEVEGVLTQGGEISGVKARDLMGGHDLEIESKLVVNATGPWSSQVQSLLGGQRKSSGPALSKAFNLLVDRQMAKEYAFGVYSKSQFNDRDFIVSKGARIFFITPWRGRSLIGTEHLPYQGQPDSFQVTEEEIHQFLQDINQAYPPANLNREDVLAVYGGMLPADGFEGDNVRLSKHHHIYDHGKEGGLQGLISMVGVKFTESRYVAEKVVDLVFRKLGKSPPRSVTTLTPIRGGETGEFDAFLARQLARRPEGLSDESIKRLVCSYGSAYPEVLQYLDHHQAYEGDEALRLYKAQVIHAVRHEMAQKLSDVVLRRLGWGTVGVLPQKVYLHTAAKVMAAELGWDESRTRSELAEVNGGTSKSPSPVLSANCLT